MNGRVPRPEWQGRGVARSMRGTRQRSTHADRASRLWGIASKLFGGKPARGRFTSTARCRMVAAGARGTLSPQPPRARTAALPNLGFADAYASRLAAHPLQIYDFVAPG
ncbi:unnamed protein product, partial [Iphiclides podalirius]